LLFALGAWWVYLIIKLAEGENKYTSEKLISMVKWEGGTFFILLLALSISLLLFYLKDKRRTHALQAFFSSLTHELKTPLASIRLQGEVLHDKVQSLIKDDKSIGELTNRLIQDTNRLEIQMDKILQLSRMERGGNLNLAPVNLIDYLRNIEKSSGKYLNFKFDFAIENDEAYILADEFALDLIYKNLFENTQKHSKEENVHIKVTDYNSTLMLKYSDNGIFNGDKKLLGNLFYKHSSSKGSGIGLYLIKNLLKKMQGDFKFEVDNSEDVNKIIFYLWFKKADKGFFRWSNFMTNSSILIVEDETNLGVTLSEYLQSKDYQCFHAENAVQAREYFNKDAPRIVLMDIGLPDGNGLDLAREFRDQRKDFVLLFLSALNDPDTKVEGLELGAEDYITKPFALKELMLRLERILKNYSELDNFPNEIKHGTLSIYFKRFEVHNSLGVIPLNQKECGILELLYRNKNEAVTRDHIIESIWGKDAFPSNRTVDNYIVKLRKWSDKDPDKTIEIQSVRGIGYKMVISEENDGII